MAVIYGSDKLYAEHAESLTRRLKDAGAQWIVLAGRPGESEQGLRDAGLHDFIYLGCNALECLANLWKQWEVQS